MLIFKQDHHHCSFMSSLLCFGQWVFLCVFCSQQQLHELQGVQSTGILRAGLTMLTHYPSLVYGLCASSAEFWTQSQVHTEQKQVEDTKYTNLKAVLVCLICATSHICFFWLQIHCVACLRQAQVWSLHPPGRSRYPCIVQTNKHMQITETFVFSNFLSSYMEDQPELEALLNVGGVL
jgi:hypothetical protein